MDLPLEADDTNKFHFGSPDLHKRIKSVSGDLKRKIGEVGKTVLCLEFSDHGTGDFRSPSQAWLTATMIHELTVALQVV